MFGAEVAKQFGASLMAKIALLSFMPGRYSESRVIPGTAAKTYRNVLQEQFYIAYTGGANRDNANSSRCPST